MTDDSPAPDNAPARAGNAVGGSGGADTGDTAPAPMVISPRSSDNGTNIDNIGNGGLLINTQPIYPQRVVVQVAGAPGAREAPHDLPPECTVAQAPSITLYQPEHDHISFNWYRIDGRDAPATAWLQHREDIPLTVRDALLTTESRPRFTMIGDGAFLNIRALGATPEDDPDYLVSIRMWLTFDRVVTVGLRTANVTDQMVAEYKAGKFRDPGDLVSRYATVISEQLDREIAALGDELDELELSLENTKSIYAHRQKVSSIRSDSIHYRRFIIPQFQALDRFANGGPTWLDKDDILRLRDAADRFARMGEELEAVRERSALMREELTDQRSEVMDSRALMISIVALIFLPLTFLTGLLGMNVKGIPFADRPWAFDGVVAFCVTVAGFMGAYFVRAHWTR